LTLSLLLIEFGQDRKLEIFEEKLMSKNCVVSASLDHPMPHSY
jgi:hypothetical protein